PDSCSPGYTIGLQRNKNGRGICSASSDLKRLAVAPAQNQIRLCPQWLSKAFWARRLLLDAKIQVELRRVFIADLVRFEAKTAELLQHLFVAASLLGMFLRADFD